MTDDTERRLRDRELASLRGFQTEVELIVEQLDTGELATGDLSGAIRAALAELTEDLAKLHHAADH